MIAAFGSMCCVCQYDRLAANLEFHHLDPATKEITASALCVSPRAWPRIVDELRKCVLVCLRCHREIHAGLTEPPADATRFDETFLDYKTPTQSVQPEGYRRKRPIRLTCTDSELGEMVETMTLTDIALKFGVLPGTVRKRLNSIHLFSPKK